MKQWNDPFAPTPEGFRLRVEQTLSGLEEKKMKQKFKPVAALAVVLAVILLTATGFAAVKYLSGTVDWNGKFIPDKENSVPVPTSIPETETEIPDSPAHAELENIPDGEVWRILKPWGVSSSTPNSYPAESLEQFEKYLYGTTLPMPGIPEGMTLSIAEIHTPPEAYPYEEIVYEDEILQKFKMQPLFAGFATAYNLGFSDEGDGYLYFRCSKEDPSFENHSFGINEGDTYEMLDRKDTGWEHGIYILHSDGDQSITLQYVWENSLTHFTLRTYGTNLTKDDLLALIPNPW